MRSRILIVEDEKIVAVDLQLRLEGHGYSVVDIASTGEEAIHAARKTRPDIILMDITLRGGMDGIAAADEIRKGQDIPIIYVTAHADSGTLDRAKVTGPFGYVLKPFEERELHTAIEMALYKHAMDRRMRENERSLATTLRSIADAVITTDHEGKITYMNPVAEHLSGWAHEEALGKNLTDVCLMADELTGVLQENPALVALRMGSVQSGHGGITSRGGMRAWVDHTAAPIRDDDGSELGAVLVLRDMTERRQAAKSLRESEERFRGAFESANSGMAIIAVDGKFLKVNRTLCRMLGYTEEELLAVCIRRLIHPDDAGANDDDATKMLSGEFESQWHERRYLHRSGRVVWSLVSTTLVRDAHGDPKYFILMIQDITERKEAEEGLQVQKAFFQQLFESSPEGVLVIDNDDAITDANGTFLSMFQYAIDEVKGRRVNDLLVPEELAGEASEYSSAVFRNQVVQAETVRRRKDGSLIHVSLMGSPIVLAGRAVGAYGIYRDISERKRAEERLLTLSRAVEQSSASIIITDTQGTIEYVNEAFVQVTGFPREEAIGKNPRILKTGETQREEYQRLWDTITTGGEWSGVFHNRKKNGELFWEHASISPIKTLDGEIRHFLAVKEDITERRKAEESLARERTLLRTLIDNLPDYIYVKDTGLRFMAANAAQLRLLGVSRSEAVAGKTEADFLPRRVADHSKSLEEAVLRTGKPLINSEEQIIDRSGLTRWVQITKVALRDESGAVIGLVGVSHDITDRKQAEQELQEGARRLQTIIETVDEGITLSDLVGRFEVFNSKMEQITGYSLAEVNDADDFSALLYPDPQARQIALDGLKGILETGKTNEVEVLIRTKSGEEKALLVSTSLVRYKNRSMFLSAFRDITGRKRAEREMEVYAERLLQAKSEAEAQARMLEQQARELEQAREQALEASRLKSEFVANMSHEIRTPMNGVIGMTGLLLDTGLTNEQREYTEIIRTSGESLLTIINDILDFSKIEAGKLALELIDFDLRTVVEDSVDLLAQKAHEKQLEFVTFMTEEVPAAAHGDPGRLRQVLVNLLSNAIKFTEKGEISLTTSVEMDTESSTMVRFRIKDTGIGIPPERRSRLFKSFSQADGSTTRKYGGTGLGLIISKQLVELMGGAIGVESQPGLGTEFWFTVTLKKARCAPAGSSRRDELSGVRALIVDDNSTSRTILAHVTEQWGMRSTAVSNGSDALEELLRALRGGDPYRIGIFDMHMPEMDGLTLAQVVKADPRISGTVIVLLTSLGHGNGWGSDPSLAAYLTKPVKETALYDTLVRVLGPIKTESQNAQVEGPVPEGVAVVQRSLRILIAEDNAINQKVAVRMLAKIGCRADVVGDGREAVEALKQAPYDIVFMDCNMPEMDGFAATRAIRALEGDRRHAVIIAMTANALQGDRDRVLEVGMDDYIAKPVNQKELAAMIDHWTTRISPLPVPQRGGDAGQPPPRTEVLNSLRLAELAELADEGDTTWLRSLIEKYIEDTAQRLIELRQAIEGGKARQAGELAHALKGSSNNIGVVNLVGPAHELQKLGEAESLGNAVALLEQLESGFQEAKAEFEAHYLAQEGSK